MGIIPEIKTNIFNSQFNYWKAFARQNKLSNDTINCTHLVTEKLNNIDIILLACTPGIKNDIVVLNPRFSKAKIGEEFQIISCEYSDSGCHQRQFNVTMHAYENGQLWIKSEHNFAPSGFSGAPLIDSNGLVLGIVSSGIEVDGELYIIIEPLTKLKEYFD